MVTPLCVIILLYADFTDMSRVGVVNTQWCYKDEFECKFVKLSEVLSEDFVILRMVVGVAESGECFW